jgi:Spy/CpxP family protein refolding chaperone
MMGRLTLIAAAALWLSAPVLAAQQHQHGQGQGTGMGMGMGQGMEHAAMLHGFMPDQLLAKRADLALTDDQVKQLEQLQADAKKAHDQAAEGSKQHQKEMMDALQAAQPSAQAVRAHFQGAHESVGAAHWAMIDASLKAMALLTPEQKEKVKSWAGDGCKSMPARN